LSFYQEGFLQSKDAEQLLRRIAPNMMTTITAKPQGDELASRVNEFEAQIIRETLQSTGSIRKAAEKLGVPKSTLSRKMKNKNNTENE